LLGASAAAAQDKATVKTLSAKELAAEIDRHIGAKLAKNKITSAPAATDTEFLRRVYLDLGGRIPKVADIQLFLDRKAADKRGQVIDELLGSPLFADHYSNTLRVIMIPQQSSPQFSFLGRNFQNWLVEQIRNDVPYDKLVYEILTVNTSAPPKPGTPGAPAYYAPNNNGPFAFFQANQNKAENLAAATTRTFLGVRLECAQCHDHPFTDWKKNQFWEFAAFFSNTGGVLPGSPVKIQLPEGAQPPQPAAKKPSIIIPGTGKTVFARYLDGKDPEFRAAVHPRVTLAEWLTARENPYFARTTANRVWGHFFGIGLIDPVDDEPSKDNPPSHPELLKLLTEQLVAHNFDVKYLMRAIALSQTYQRTSRLSDDSQKDARLFAKMTVRGMTAEQLFDSLIQSTNFPEPNLPQVYYTQNSARAKFVADFANTDNPTETTTSILQALKMMNGKFIADATGLQSSHTLAALAETPFLDAEGKVRVLFLSTVSRQPTDSELNQLTTYVNSGGPRNDPNAALGDIYWALLNSSEFRLNH
jgi:hypothetical protein